MVDGFRCLAAATLLATAAITLTACSDDTPPGGDVDSGECAGDQSGDTTVAASYPSPLPGGGEAGIGTVEADQDPPVLNIVLGGDATKDERDGATDLSVGDTFTVRKTTYTVAGFCEDKAWLDKASS